MTRLPEPLPREVTCRTGGKDGHRIPAPVFAEVLGDILREVGGVEELGEQISAAGLMSAASAARRCRAILAGEWGSVTLPVADTILTSLGESHRWYEPPLDYYYEENRVVYRADVCGGCSCPKDECTIGCAVCRLRRWRRDNRERALAAQRAYRARKRAAKRGLANADTPAAGVGGPANNAREEAA